MRWTPSLILLLAACANSESPDPEGCLADSLPSSVSDSVLVPSAQPLCDLELVEVAVLRGEIDGIAPRPPIVPIPAGGFVTATYQPGKMAVWSADGVLESVIGNGPGVGPGEFDIASTILVSEDQTIHVSEGFARWHRYSPTGDYLGTESVPDVPGILLLEVGEDSAIYGMGEPAQIFRWDGSFDVVRPAILQAGSRFGVAATSEGIWIAPHTRAELIQVSQDLETVERTIRRSPTGSDENAGRLYFLDDYLGLLWTGRSVADPAAPDEPSQSQDPAQLSRFIDNLVEAVSPSGMLVVSQRFDDVFESPIQAKDGFWFIVSDDLVPSVRVVRPKLVGRTGTRTP